MGRAVVTANLGESLYRIRLTYDQTALVAELAEIAKAEAEYGELLAAATKTMYSLDEGRQAAAEGLRGVLDQWSADLIAPADPSPPPDFPGGGSTGEAAESAALLTAINDARAAASLDDLTESAALTAEIRATLETLANLGRESDTTYTPEQRATRAGYAYDAAVGVGEVIAFGFPSASAVVASWLRRTSPAILGAGYTEIGVRALYRPTSPWGYAYGVLLAAPGAASTVVYPADDPAKDKADKSDETLEKVEPPKPPGDVPDPVQAAVAALAKASQAYRQAADEVERLRLAHVERQRRANLLEDLAAAAQDELYAWACQWSDAIAVGTAVYTAEVPGWRGDGVAAATVMGQRNDPDDAIADYVVTYTESPINIVPDIYADAGMLRWSESLNDCMSFVNAALEPGWLKWEPLYRYGTIAAIGGATCTVTLDDTDARGGSALEIDESRTVAGVPIVAPCASLYLVGDAVLVRYVGQDREQPQIIGWRREPLPCAFTIDRVSWGQIV